MGPNELCCITVTFYCFFICPMSFFIRIYFVTSLLIIFLYMYLYSCRSSSSTKFQCRFYIFYNILVSLSTVFLSRLTSDSTTFKVAVSHFHFLPTWIPYIGVGWSSCYAIGHIPWIMGLTLWEIQCASFDF